MSANTRIQGIEGGVSALGQLSLLRAAGALTRPFHFRGMQRFTRIVSRAFKSTNRAVVNLRDGGRLSMYLRDSHWTGVLDPRFEYEPEVGFVLRKALQLNHRTVFFDCGANIGYWSCQAASILRGSGTVVAIEASPVCFEQLQHNAMLNDNSFHSIMRAVWSSDDQELTIVSHNVRHAGASVVNRREKRGRVGYSEFVVRSITLDTLYKTYIEDNAAAVIVKLDVEGAEIPALEGAAELLQRRDMLIVYEDHIQDTESVVTAYILERLGYRVYYCTESHEIVPIRTVADVRSVKRRIRTGFNFFTCPASSQFSQLFKVSAVSSRAHEEENSDRCGVTG